MLEQIIDGNTAVSIGTLIGVVSLTLTAGLTAVISAVTTRNKVGELTKDLTEIQSWRKEHRKDHETERSEHATWRKEHGAKHDRDDRDAIEKRHDLDKRVSSAETRLATHADRLRRYSGPHQIAPKGDS